MGMFRRWRPGLASSWWGLILAEHDTEPVELIGGCTKVAMGIWLLLPFESFASSRSFAALTVLPEWAWGAFLVIAGLGHVAALHNGNRTWRRWSSFVGFLVWASFAIVFVWNNPPAIGWLMFLSVGLAQLWANLRLGVAA